MAKRKTMRMETVESGRRGAVRPGARHLGLRRSRLGKRWRDDWAYLMSNPANAKWIADSIAELDRGRELRGAPPFDRGRADAGAS
jgi:hypothetical protein